MLAGVLKNMLEIDMYRSTYDAVYYTLVNSLS